MPTLSIAALAFAQLTSPPEFQSGGTFQTTPTSATIDGTSHVSAEQTRIHEELFARLRKLPGHGEGIRLIEARLLPAATGHFREHNQPLGAAVTEYLGGRVEASAKELIGLMRKNPASLVYLPFAGETIGTVPELSGAMLAGIRRIARAHPEHAEAQYYLARALLKQAAPPPAAEISRLLRRAANLDRTDSRALLDLARLHNEQQQGPEAIAALQELLKRDPNLAAAHYRLAGLYRAAGAMEKSREHLQHFQRLQAAAKQ